MPEDPPKSAGKRLEVAVEVFDDQRDALSRMRKEHDEPDESGGTRAIGAGSWTVMVYMAVDDTLRPFADRDVKEMQLGLRGLAKSGFSDRLRVVVQKHVWMASPERFEVLENGPKPLSINKDETISDLAGFLRQSAQQFKAKHYLVVLWGHAYGLKFGRFDDQIVLPELRKAITSARFNPPIDILGFDACGMGKLEIVGELRELATYLIASQVNIPYSGWPYDMILREITRNPGIPPKNLGTAILRRFYESYSPPRVALTMLSGKANYANLNALQEALGNAIAAELPAVAKLAAKAFSDARTDSVEPLFDLRKFCTNLNEALTAGNGAISPEGAQPITKLAVQIDALLKEDSPNSVVLDLAKRGPGSKGLNGLGTYGSGSLASVLENSLLNEENLELT